MRTRITRRIAMLLGGLVSAAFVACATIGGIPASTFQFYNVIPHVGPSEGGWKVAQVSIRMTWQSGRKVLESWCEVEVGVPERNHLGTVLDVDAQETAANSADQAAHHVLRVLTPKPATSADLCLSFRLDMQRRMNLSIPGAKVDRFQRQGIPRTTFASSVQE